MHTLQRDSLGVLKFLGSVKFQYCRLHVFIFSHESKCFQILCNSSHSQHTRRKVSISQKMCYFLALRIHRLEDTLIYILAVL